ncbi:hypothetical protein HWV62_25977 [Athelia sp. TMB]|nr:hypothetical protein HWV62_25977 [Athelia sp. TMB]
MTRRKNAGGSSKPGKKSWISGTKARFLQSHNEAWVSATNRGSDAARSFYSDVTKLWIKKYGWHFDRNGDLEEDTPDPTQESLLEPEEAVDDEEAERRKEYYSKMRECIRSYYYRANKTVSAADAAKEITEILENAAEAAPKPPRRPRILHYYSNIYYPERIKPIVDAEWAMMMNSLGNEEDGNKFVDFQNKVTQRFWENETQAFRDNLKMQLKEEYLARHLAFEEHIERVATQNPESAEAYHSRFSIAGATLNNLCDALSKQYGMNVSIFLCGPIGARDGSIEMRSVHSGVTIGLNPLKWPQACPEEFRKVLESMVSFSKRCYTLQQCKARSLGGTGHKVNLDESAALGTDPEGFGLYTLDGQSKDTTPSPPSLSTQNIAQDASSLHPKTATPLDHPQPLPTNSADLVNRNKGALDATAPDFNVFTAGGSLADVAPPEGLDFINTDFSGVPENLSLLTQHLHDEHDQWDAQNLQEQEQSPWDVFKELMNAGEQSATSRGNNVGSLLDGLGSPSPTQLEDGLANIDLDGVLGLPTLPTRPRGDSSATLADRAAAALDSAINMAGPPLCIGRTVDAACDAPPPPPGLAASASPPPALSLDTASSLSPVGSTSTLGALGDLPAVDISVEFADCPQTSRGAYAPLFKVADKLGPDFRACVRSFLKLECAARWTSKDHRLPSADRPSEYKEWMRYARPAGFDKDGAKFGEKFGECLWLWWSSMQLKERKDENGCLMRADGSSLEWGSLAAPGKSGIFLVVLGLYWWAQRDGGRVQDRWREALADVAWAKTVTENMVHHGGMPKADAAAAGATRTKSTPTGDPKGKRKREDTLAVPEGNRRRRLTRG